MKKKTNTINNWGVLSIYFSYLKRTKAIFFTMFFIPLIFIVTFALNYKDISNNGKVSVGLILMLLWLINSSSFILQTFLSILLDFKQTIIYRRIGLTRIKKINFLIISSIFNFILVTISNFFIFLITIILIASFNQTHLFHQLFKWKFILIILFTFVCLLLFTSITILLSTFIKSRTVQTIVVFLINFLVIAPLFVLTFFLNNLFINKNFNVGQTLGIFFASFLLIYFLSILIYYVSWKKFKWYD